MTKTEKTPATQAVEQLARSERGRETCRLLREFLDSSTVNGLDAGNRNAVLLLVHEYLCEFKTADVMDNLNDVKS